MSSTYQFRKKYQMLNTKLLIDSIPKHLTESQNGQQVNFSFIDLKNAYSQLQLHKEAATQSNFYFICGESTRT